MKLAKLIPEIKIQPKFKIQNNIELCNFLNKNKNEFIEVFKNTIGDNNFYPNDIFEMDEYDDEEVVSIYNNDPDALIIYYLFSIFKIDTGSYIEKFKPIQFKGITIYYL